MKVCLPCRLGLFLLLAVLSVRAAEHRTFHHENVLGTSLELRLTGNSVEAIDRAEQAVLKEIDRLGGLLSGYQPTSEFSRWSQTRDVASPVSTELLEVLAAFDLWREKTGGALNPAAEALSRTWREAEKLQHLPSYDALLETVTTVRRPHWQLNAAEGTATHLDSVPLVLNSFTKSYIASRACDVALRSEHIDSVRLNLGGDIVTRGAATETIVVADPRDDSENGPGLTRLAVRNHTVATSGGYRRGFTIEGRHFSHILDPRTGQPADQILSATVLSPSAVAAGALATAFCVLTPSESLRLIATVPGAECLILERNGMRHTSPGWARFVVSEDRLAVRTETEALADLPPAKGSAAWDSSMELGISFELARLEGQRAKRPFVAVWVEDKDGFPVRTLALWFNKPKWLPDLKSWNRSDKLRALADGTDLTTTVSSATRSPGKYTLKWDGRDDKGQPVKAGKYTVFLEAAREHGTHQVMHKEMDFSGQPAKFDLPGNAEISGANLDYHARKPQP